METPELPIANGMNIFYFAITPHFNREKALACNTTWVQTLHTMHWYSDEPNLEMNHTDISYKFGSTYQLVTYRAKWYLITYSSPLPDMIGMYAFDNYFFKERLEKFCAYK